MSALLGTISVLWFLVSLISIIVFAVKKNSAWKKALISTVVAFAVFCYAISLPSEPAANVSKSIAPTAKQQEPAKAPKLECKVESSKYEYGYLKLVGTIKNTGTAAAFSPALRIKVYKDAAKTVLLAEDMAHPAGAFLEKMEPGNEAAFESITRIPGEPKDIHYTYEVK